MLRWLCAGFLIALTVGTPFGLSWNYGGGNAAAEEPPKPPPQRCGSELLDIPYLVDPSGFPVEKRRPSPLVLDTSQIFIELRSGTVDVVPVDLPGRWQRSDISTETIYWMSAQTGEKQYFRRLYFDPPLAVCELLNGLDDWYLQHEKMDKVSDFRAIRLVIQRGDEIAVLDNTVTVWLAPGANPETVAGEVVSTLDALKFNAEKVPKASDFQIDGSSGDLRLTLMAGTGTHVIRLALKLSEMGAWFSRVRLNTFAIESAVQTRTRIERLRLDGTSYRFAEGETPLGIPYELPGWQWVMEVDLLRDGYWHDRNIGAGACGMAVDDLQRFLIRRNTGPAAQALGLLAEDCFGERTRAALAEYQRARGIIPASGFLGPKTRSVMRSEAKPFYALQSSPQEFAGLLRQNIHNTVNGGDAADMLILDPGCVGRRLPAVGRYERQDMVCRFTVANAGNFESRTFTYRLEDAATGSPISMETERSVPFTVGAYPKDGAIAFLPDPKLVFTSPEPSTPQRRAAPVEVPLQTALEQATEFSEERIVDPAASFASRAFDWAAGCVGRGWSCSRSLLGQGVVWALVLLIVFMLFMGMRVGRRRLPALVPLAIRRAMPAARWIGDWAWRIPRLAKANPMAGYRRMLERATGEAIGNLPTEDLARRFGVSIPSDADTLTKHVSDKQKIFAFASPLTQVIFAIAVEEWLREGALHTGLHEAAAHFRRRTSAVELWLWGRGIRRELRGRSA